MRAPDPTDRFTVGNDRTGGCGHAHRSLAAAQRCMTRDGDYMVLIRPGEDAKSPWDGVYIDYYADPAPGTYEIPQFCEDESGSPTMGTVARGEPDGIN